MVEKLLYFIEQTEQKSVPLYLQKENITNEIHLFDSKALSSILSIKPWACIFDFNTNENNFLELLHIIKKHPVLQHTLIIFYTSISDPFFELACYEAGLDLMISKPKKNRVLFLIINRLKTFFYKPDIQKKKTEETKRLVIDREHFIVYKDQRSYYLSKKEFELLELLSKRPGKVFTRNEIAEAIWKDLDSSKTRTIDVHIRKLRDKLGDDIIKTIKGIGYSINI